MNNTTLPTVDRRIHLKIVVLALFLGILTLALEVMFKAPAGITPAGLTESVRR